MSRRTKSFLIGSVLGVLLAAFGMLIFGRTSETRVLIAIKSQDKYLSSSSDSAVDNAEIILKGINTYDRIFESSSEISDAAFLENSQKWEGMLNVKRIKKSTVLGVSLVQKDPAEGKSVMEGLIPAFMSEFSRFYNIKTEFRAWVLQGPFTVEKNIFSRSQMAFWSILSGIITGILSALSFGKKMERRLVEIFSKANYFPELPMNEKDHNDLKKEKKQVIYPDDENQMTEKRVETGNVVSGKSGAAPSNLPVAGDDIERMFGASKNGRGYKIPEKKESAEESAEEKPAVYREATPEEVKERLNKLLGSI